MTTLHAAHTLLLEGPDAIAFAQSQFSNNVASLSDGRWQFNAWLDAQGRVQALFHLVRLGDERLLLLLRGGNSVEMAAALQRFVFRARVRLAPASSAALARGPALPLFDANRNGDVVMLGCGDHSLLCGDVPGNDDWRQAQLHNGWAWLPETVAGTLPPPALSLYRLPAVALDKGCYPGQEIVARLHYRGGHKRHLHRIALSQVVPNGATLHTEDLGIVQLLQAVPREHDTEALAVMSDALTTRSAQGLAIVTDEGLQLRVEASWGD